MNLQIYRQQPKPKKTTTYEQPTNEQQYKHKQISGERRTDS